MIATFYWEKAYTDFTTPEKDKMTFVKRGLDAVDKALQLKGDYPEALTYKGLLLRVQARLEKDPKVQQALLREATTYSERAAQVRAKQRASGAE